MSNKKSVQKHHYMVVGQLYFSDNEQPDRIQSMMLNGVLIIDTKNITSASIGKSQQILQLHFRKRMGEMEANVLDVVIHQFSYLGLMSEAEFTAPPPGFKLQEVTPSSLEDAVAAADKLASH